MNESVPGQFRRWTPTAVLLGVTFLTRGSQNAAMVTFPLLGHQKLGLSATYIGIVAALSGLFYAAASFGFAARAQGRLLLLGLMAGLGTFSIGYALFALSHDAGVYVAAAVMIGVGGGLCFPCLISLAAHTGPDGMERSVTRYTVALSFSLLVGPLMEAGVLALTHNSLSGTFWFFAPWPLLAALAAGVLHRRWALVLSSIPTRPAGKWKPVGRQSRFFRLALWSQLIYEVPFSAVVSFGGLLAITIDHLKLGSIAILFGVFYLVSMAIRIIVALQSPIANKRALLTINSIVTLVGVGLICISGIPPLICGMVLLGTGHGISYPISLSLIAEGIQVHDISVANARLTGIVKIVDIALPLVFGVVIETLGYRYAFLLLAIPVIGFSIPTWLSAPGTLQPLEAPGEVIS